ncbi:PEP/pyruvate-binding domain-containing protein [Streptococcus dysgalactiae subsp. equisimilis]|uniref:PEP/pyruvate-binding domain-containing protein n=1 Tax=Streptococcus dysgalactiae TaxID=1334 RepID=UPI000617BBEF|nr:PEP/pyruvate-binding domain-containing protein [Streptococcus dysgalactiae]KKC21802.1 phosphoenolpyruvate synthase [Streptococcus dysgalactiae subsp. equisimilis]MCY7196625.1 PEP-utilizing enzyme [Streptococcus dysgalactiae]MCY7200247.1 PEP-utilizing enzyme [Streptococcus dysgalactiae]MCY7205766.1 PEP-utilizing enzyme [Streptococcus dysgalactiae]MCY7215810.1 PEP-utilizing enzyme [Streptococcus dysgalactiae]
MILDFNEIKKEDVLVAGGKGANLGEMTSAKINVPSGFVITADAYRDFLKVNGIDILIENGIKKSVDDKRKLLNEAEHFRGKIKSGKFPERLENAIREKYFNHGNNTRVAVRSSATAEDLPDASFAGQQETYLNVQGIESVLNAVRNCYASLWGNRAVSYRFHQGYDQTSVSIAVVIQEMIESEKSGVLFTVNPVNKKENEMQINASFGLGESVVSGRVTADSYIIDKSGKIAQVNIGSKETQIIYGDKETVEVAVSSDKRKTRALNDREILELMKCGLEIEKHYRMPMDIEWAIKNDIVYILQARAITTLKNSGNDITGNDLIEKYIKGKKIKKDTREVMSFFLEKMPFAHRVLDFDYLMAINDQKVNILSEGGIILPRNPIIDDDGIQTFSDEGKRIGKNIFKFFNILKNMKDFEFCYKKCKDFMNIYETEIEEIKHLNFENMTLMECGNFLEESYALLQKLAYDRFKYALFPSVLNSKKFTKIIKKVNSNYSSFDFYWDLDNKTSVITNDVYTMACEIRKNEALKRAIISGDNFKELYKKFNDFKNISDEFMKDNGFKSDYNCYCLSAKTFLEDPDRLTNILRPILNENSNESKDTKDFSKLMESIEGIYGKKYQDIEKQIKYFRYFHVVREESQYLWETLFYYVRKCVKRINFILLGDENIEIGVANLFHKELLKAINRGNLNESDKEKINRRNEKFPLAVKVWEASKLLIFKTDGDVLKGVSGSTGIAVGKVCLINSPKEFYKMKKGDILVCHLTDPEWTPLFKLASAVVADTGSALSHAAIVAREYNIPAVLGVGFATTKFKDGDTIQVDGNTGEVIGC